MGRGRCPRCLAVIEVSEGQREVTCPSCHATLRLPARSPSAGAPAPTPTPPAAVTCPGCGAPLQEGAAVCVSCGLDLRTGRRMETEAGAEFPMGAAYPGGVRTTRRRRAWAFPVKGIILLILLGAGGVAAWKYLPRGVSRSKYIVSARRTRAVDTPFGKGLRPSSGDDVLLVLEVANLAADMVDDKGNLSLKRCHVMAGARRCSFGILITIMKTKKGAEGKSETSPKRMFLVSAVPASRRRMEVTLGDHDPIPFTADQAILDTVKIE